MQEIVNSPFAKGKIDKQEYISFTDYNPSHKKHKNPNYSLA